MAMGHDEKVKGGDEFDTVTKWRKVLDGKPGKWKKVKSRMSKRNRRNKRRELKNLTNKPVKEILGGQTDVRSDTK